MPKRQRGTGSVFLPKGSAIWWCAYSLNSVQQRESTGTRNKREAISYLNNKVNEVASGNCLGAEASRITCAELAADKLLHDKNQGSKSLSFSKMRWEKHLKPVFEFVRAAQVSTPLLNKYIAQRQEQKASNGTINRELAFMRAAFNLAARSTPRRVVIVPHFPQLKETNIRTGFLSDAEFNRLADECLKVGVWLRTLLELGATYGWRKSELLRMKVSQIDLDAKSIRLNPGETKNDDGREVTMSSIVHSLLTACVMGKGPEDYVITWGDGRQVKDFRGSWETATAAAGVPNLYFHDLRRTAARNLRRAGAAEGVIMKIGGWRTRSIFERYAIVAQSDIKDAMNMLEAHKQEARAEAKEKDEVKSDARLQ